MTRPAQLRCVGLGGGGCSTGLVSVLSAKNVRFGVVLAVLFSFFFCLFQLGSGRLSFSRCHVFRFSCQPLPVQWFKACGFFRLLLVVQGRNGRRLCGRGGDVDDDDDDA